ncbi:MAG: acetyl-CoA carboxylase biotin carboxyl carrier protein [Sarcina sp.]
MEFKEIESLISKIDNSNISLFELKLNDFYLKMDKSLTRESASTEEKATASKSESVAPVSKKIDIQEEIKIDNQELKREKGLENTKQIQDDCEVITSPMVGTFYSAPGADRDIFAPVGKKVNTGDTLCIIEAMKLMNELEAEFPGEIVEILVENGDMVEFGTELFKIRRV